MDLTNKSLVCFPEKKNWTNRIEKIFESKIEANTTEMMALVCRSKKYIMFQEKSIQ